jgi:tetratricopeptide (TPR) repeat protein
MRPAIPLLALTLPLDTTVALAVAPLNTNQQAGVVLANVYRQTGRFDQAENAYKEARDVAAHRADLATTLANLRAVYANTKHFDEAERAFKKALAIQRDLAAQNPNAYRPELATTLNNLGNVYGDTHHFDKAEDAYKEALAIRRDLVDENPGAYRPNLVFRP